MRVLITGGAGFIGLHTARELLSRDFEVTLFDNLSPQIHVAGTQLPSDIKNRVHFIHGDVTNANTFHAALLEQDAVIHLAAETGTGQSMYEIDKYTGVNITGTSNLMDFIVNNAESRIKNIVVASSRAIYGEGKYDCQEHGVVYPTSRTYEDLNAGNFEPRCPDCDAFVTLLPTTENSAISPSSFYGLTKRVQEDMTLLFARSKGITATALRYQNVYGPGQSLINPYTGILAIFSNLAKTGSTIKIFEDGAESRDFVFVKDVARATVDCLLLSDNKQRSINIGSGVATSVISVAEGINKYFGSRSQVQVSGAFRLGDIRHNVADLTLSKKELNFTPLWNFEAGITEFLDWAFTKETYDDSAFIRSVEELKSRGMYHDQK